MTATGAAPAVALMLGHDCCDRRQLGHLMPDRLPPKKHPKLQESVTLIAQLGGYVVRKNNEPGTQSVSIGMQRMYDLAMAWDALGPESKIKRS